MLSEITLVKTTEKMSDNPLDTIMGYKPCWYAACNGVTQFSENGYNCDGASLSPVEEKKTRNLNKNRILTYVNSLIGKQEVVSSRKISETLGLIEEFVIAVLEIEFGELEDDEHE